MIARTMLLPAAIRYLELCQKTGVDSVASDVQELIGELNSSLDSLANANDVPEGLEGLDLAVYARDNQIARMADVREVADKLEKIVPDDLWPLPKYSEMLFIR
jgi:glutamine synthetase